jgi:hypothetical protein
MTEAPAQPGMTSTVPPPSANGSTPSTPPALPPPQPPPAPQPPPPRQSAHIRLSRLRTGLLAVAGTARITQLRQHMRRDRHNSQVS